MTRKDKITLRQSEIRTELSGLLDMDVEKRAEDFGGKVSALTKEMQGLELELRAAVVIDGTEAEPVETRSEGDAETREKRELLGRASLANFIKAAVSGKTLSGAEAEASDAFGCPGLVPLELFDSLRVETRSEQPDALETRAVTPSPATVGQTLAPTVPTLFDQSVAAWLGIEMPTVGGGTPGYPVVSANLTGGMKAKSAAAAETEGAITVSTATPKRLTGSFRITREDLAVLPTLETTLRQNLQRVLSDVLDGQLLNGSGAGANLNGLFNQLTDAAAPAANAESFTRYAAAISSHIDGLYAVDRMGVRALVGPHTYRHMAGVFATNDDAVSAMDYLARTFGGLRASRRIADPANNIQGAIIRRANPANDRVAVAPVWSGLELIRDAITGAGKGEIVVTGLALVGGVVLLRGGVFQEDSFRLA